MNVKIKLKKLKWRSFKEEGFTHCVRVYSTIGKIEVKTYKWDTDANGGNEVMHVFINDTKVPDMWTRKAGGAFTKDEIKGCATSILTDLIIDMIDGRFEC